jgi:hypothetical protein
LRNDCEFDVILNECHTHLPRKPFVLPTQLFNRCLRLSQFPKPWKKAKVVKLLKPGTEPKLPQNLHSISLLSTTGNLLKKVILKIVQWHIEEKGVLNASQFGFLAHHNTVQCIKLTDHVNLNFNNNMSMASVFLDIKKEFYTNWYLGLLYKLSELKLFIRLIKLISSFLSQRKFRVSVVGEVSTPRDNRTAHEMIQYLIY